ncbi:cytochrome c3 family protein [Sulfurimonas sp.]|nr:cytochrome c3 family protein [Sulfurimonas sp.]
MKKQLILIFISTFLFSNFLFASEDINEQRPQYTLLAWNDLGMHCMDGKDFSIFSILPPYNTINAQLIRKADKLNKDDTFEKHVTSGVTISYRASESLDERFNTTSLLDTNKKQKTNFWDYSKKIFNTDLEPDVGLTGNHTPDKKLRNFIYDKEHNWWEASGLPISPYDDDGTKNYYPMVDVIAKDLQGNILASTKIVLPVSDEMDCKACHGSKSNYEDAMPRAGWVNEIDEEKDFKLNILKLHDEEHPKAVLDNLEALKKAGYHGYDTAGLYETTQKGNPILCATCHASNALPGMGIEGIKPLTQSLHALHFDVDDPRNGEMLGSSTNRTSCYLCHPGEETACLRGAMGKQDNIQCQSCHGGMEAVGSHKRDGWLNEPDCQSCHQEGKRHTKAVTDETTGTLRAALDKRFATNANTPMKHTSLYRFSKGHGDMKCSACHGSTHAIYPSKLPEDNIQSIVVQGHEGTIAECRACHESTPKTNNKGPHGMHSVGDRWVLAHGDVAKKDNTDCKSCHGEDYKGSFLSKTFSKRTFNTRKFGKKEFKTGHKVSCYDCHKGPKGPKKER